MKDLKFYLLGASILLVFYLLAQYNRPKASDWSATLDKSDKIPFGTYIFYNRINDIFPGAKVTVYRDPLYNVINDNPIKNSTLIIIAHKADITEYDYNKLTGFIKSGNDVFIAAESFGLYLNKELKISTASELRSDDALKIGFVNKALKTNQYAVDKGCSNPYFSKFDTTKAVVLGQSENHKSNYIKFPMGKGNLYLNSCPLMFSNYSLLQDQGSAYASVALSYLKNDPNLIWDDYYALGRGGDGSSLRVFLYNKSLRWALYITLFSMLIFVLYEIKRRQRIIPVIEPLTNTTLDFVNVVGQVYYEQRNNSNIAQKKVAYFLEHLRTKYNLKTAVLDSEFITTLSQKSGVGMGLIEELLKQITLTRAGRQVTDNDLISLNKNIEQFYLQSR